MLETILKDFINLKNHSCCSKKNGISHSRDGLKMCSFYFDDLILNVQKPKKRHKLKDGTTIYHDYDTIKNILETEKDKLQHYKDKYGLKRIIDSFSLLYGRPYMYRPVVVKYFINKYKPKTILDCYAGWGNRLLGSLATSTNYIGIDTNSKLCDKLELMANNIIDYFNCQNNICILNQKAEDTDYSIFDYDMVYICPPYSFVEIYEDMPCYLNDDDFINTSLIPSINNMWKHLKTNGYFILTAPQSYLKYVSFNDKLIEKTIYPKNSYFSRAVHNKLEYQDIETIFVFHKS